WGIDAARAFQTITSDDDLLNKANHAVIRLLHKQRFFMYVFPKLVESASSQNDSGMTVQVVTKFSCSIEFSDCVVKYYRQHPKRDPSSRTTLIIASFTSISQTTISSVTSKCHQYFICHGHGIAGNHVISPRFDDPKSSKSNRIIP